MIAWGSLIYHGLVYSLILSSVVTVSQLFNARLWLQDYPEDIKKLVAPKTEREKKISLSVGLPFLMFMFLYPLYITFQLDLDGFLIIFFHIFGISMFGNLFDLLILDWLVFCYWNPDYLILDNTNGHKAYKNYMFHFKGFLKGTVMLGIYSLLTTLFLIYLF